MALSNSNKVNCIIKGRTSNYIGGIIIQRSYSCKDHTQLLPNCNAYLNKILRYNKDKKLTKLSFVIYVGLCILSFKRLVVAKIVLKYSI